MRRRLALFAFAVFVIAMPEFVAAQGRGSANKAPKASRPAAATAPRVKTTGWGKVKPTTPAGKVKTARSPHTKKKTTTPATTASTTTTTTATTSANALPKNTRLVARLQKLLPSGTDMNEAASGFRNQGQFVAAVHVSNNLGLDFADLKAHMVDGEMSLGQAVKTLKPGVDAQTETTRASSQAQTDLAAPRVKKNSKRR